jgi:hypothetical protein
LEDDRAYKERVIKGKRMDNGGGRYIMYFYLYKKEEDIPEVGPWLSSFPES